ncbi:MAG: hypothetical protein PHE24_00730 [Patescibacteria group bacterium]|nr:hypothetical protein [Patescibacteria group bacterium]
MIKKALKNICIFTMVLGLVFSSLPYDFLTNAISAYEKSANIVDKFWHLQRDPNVVDNFRENNIFSGLMIHYANAAVGDARIQYGFSNNSTPRTQFYNDTTNSYGGETTTVAGTATIGWVVSKESTTEDLTVMVTQSTTGVMDIFCRNSAGTWSKDISGVSVSANAATRRFDVEFEKTSGIPMVLFSRNVATTNELGYYRKTGAGCGAGSWTGPTMLNPTRVTAAVLWVELAARQTSGTNVLAAAFSDATATQGGKLEAMIWTGSAWGSESPAGAANGWSDLSIELQGTAGANAAKVFDLAFETNTGDLLVAWGTSLGANGTNGWRYATCAAALPCTWSAVQTPAGPTDDATNVACAPDPGSDAIACAAQGNAGNDLTAWRWSGTAVSGTVANADTTLLATAAGDMHVDIDWVVSGSQRMAVAAYANGNTGYRYIYYDTVGAAWRTNTNTGFAITGAPATAGQSIQVKRNPANAAQLMVSFTDANSDLWAKRLAYNGAAGGATTPLSTWSNSDGGVTLQGTVSSITSMPFMLDWINVSIQNLTINATAGSQVANLNSGATSQYAQDVSCNSAASCAAFTLAIDSGSETLTSIKITETGTANATNDLANAALFYDTDGNFANGVTGQFGSTVSAFTSEAATFSGSLAMVAGTTYYFYVRYDLAKSGAYPDGGQTVNFQIAANGDVTTSGSSIKTGAPASLAGATTVRPDITNITYPITSPLSGGRIGQGVTINGYGFGTVCDGANNKVEIGTAVVSCTGTTFTDTSITVSNFQYSSGDSYGGTGANGLLATVGGTANDARQDFYVYPDIISTTNPVSPYTNAAREYDAGDTDGVVTLNGNHFGSAQGTGVVTVLGQTAATNSWNDTAVQIQIPDSIPDDSYTGNIIINQGAGGNDATTDSYGGGTYRILPRITSFDPVSNPVGDSVVVTGNHFCQSGTCPTGTTGVDSDLVNSPAFTANDRVIFTSGIVANYWGAGGWTDTTMDTQVPTGAAVGNNSVYLKSNNYDSNAKNFTVQTLEPDMPSNLLQSRNSGFTNLIPTGGYASSTPVYFRFDTSAAAGGGKMYPQIEIRPVLNNFGSTCPGAYCEEGTGVDYDSGIIALTISTSSPDDSYHWQVRAHYVKNGDYYSAWKSYPDVENYETDADLIIDTTAPVISFSSSFSPPDTVCADGQKELSANNIKIFWYLNESGDGQIEYSKNSDLSSSIKFPIIWQVGDFYHEVGLTNLDSGTTYYYKVKSRDAAHNLGQRPQSTPYCSFRTSSVTQPAKTTFFYIMGATSGITALATSSFSVIAPEDSPSVKSAFIEVTGLVSGGSNSITIQANGVSPREYMVNSADRTFFRFVYQITGPDEETNLNLNDSGACTYGHLNNPPCNMISIAPGAGMSVDIYSAKIIVTYSYAP